MMACPTYLECWPIPATSTLYVKIEIYITYRTLTQPYPWCMYMAEIQVGVGGWYIYNLYLYVPLIYLEVIFEGNPT